jgi:uncharacterized Zn-finger protein
MKYTEQLFDGIFEPFLKKEKKNYLKGKVGLMEISHFVKNFAVEFYNKKTSHLEFKEIEKNYTNGQKDMCKEIIENIDAIRGMRQTNLDNYKCYSRATKKKIEAKEHVISELFTLKLIFQSKLKYVYDSERERCEIN